MSYWRLLTAEKAGLPLRTDATVRINGRLVCDWHVSGLFRCFGLYALVAPERLHQSREPEDGKEAQQEVHRHVAQEEVEESPAKRAPDIRGYTTQIFEQTKGKSWQNLKTVVIVLR